MSVPLWLLRSDPHLHFHRRPASPTIIIVLRCTSTPVSAKKTSLWWRANSSFVMTPCDPQFQGWKRCRRARARNDVFFAGRCTLEMKLPNIDIEGGRGRWQHALPVVAKFFSQTPVLTYRLVSVLTVTLYTSYPMPRLGDNTSTESILACLGMHVSRLLTCRGWTRLKSLGRYVAARALHQHTTAMHLTACGTSAQGNHTRSHAPPNTAQRTHAARDAAA